MAVVLKVWLRDQYNILSLTWEIEEMQILRIHLKPGQSDSASELFPPGPLGDFNTKV